MLEVLGTGLSGLVGSRIVQLYSSKFNFTNLDLTAGIDITNLNQIEQKISCSKSDTLIHLAAFTDVDRAWEEWNNKKGLCYKINVIGTKNIAQACKKFNKYLIHISTDFVFDGEKTDPYTEEDKPNPIEWYGQTKLWAEGEVEKSGCRYVILRIAYPFKAKPAPPNLETRVKLDLVRKLADKLKRGETLNMYFDQIFTPTFIDDIAKVINYCLTNKPQGLYHCVGSSFISPYNFAALVAQVFGFDKKLIKKATVKQVEQKQLRPRQVYLAISNQKLVKEFGIKMSTVEEALESIKHQL
jgi:dTDP-4-dehydrorhamnose reductase